MGTPQQITAIKLSTFYNTKRPNIPFYEEYINEEGSTGFFYVIVYGGSNKTLTQANTDMALRDSVVDKYIEHYAPGYYPFINGTASPGYTTEFNSAYQGLRTNILNSLALINFRSPAAPAPLIAGEPPIHGQARILFATSTPLMQAPIDPPADVGITSYNLERGAGAVSSTTTINLSTLPMIQDDMESFMAAFSEQARNFPGQVEMNVNFNFLQKGVENILQVIIGQLKADMDFSGPGLSLATDDYLTIDFNSNSTILQINYNVSSLASGGSIATRGFITNSKYNNYFKDPLTLATLKNYEAIAEQNKENSGLNEQSSFIDFMQNTFEGSPGADNPVSFDGAYTPDSTYGPHNNIFASRGSQDLIDVGDFTKIDKIFSTFKTSKEIQEIDNYANDPRVRKQALQSEKAKRINAAIAITNVVDKALKFEFPLAGLNDTPQGRVINQILNQFGIQELAKEAIICLTQGHLTSMSRISSAVKQELLNTSSSPRYGAPNNPQNTIQRPTLGDFKAYFSITGDPPLWKQILDIVLGALANAAFEIIKSIADMIKANCDEIFFGDVGEMDAGAEIKSRLQANSGRVHPPAIDGGGMWDGWDTPVGPAADYVSGVFEKSGLDPVIGFDYLSEVSLILSPDELCKLFNSPLDVSQNTLDKILDFNSSYTAGTVSTEMVTYNTILNFFTEVSSQVDTTTMCNDYMNSVASRLQDCVICLDEGALADNPAILELANIIEGGDPSDPGRPGITIVVPEPDFLCPENPYYIDNPIATAVIPNLFRNLVESVRFQLGTGIEAARSSFLVPVVTNEVNPALQAAFEALDIGPEAGEGFNPEVLQTVLDVFSSISGVLEDMDDPELCPDLDLSKFPAASIILDDVATVTSVIGAGGAAAMQELTDKIEQIQANAGEDSGNAPYVQYRFSQQYKNSFINAISHLNFDHITTMVPNGWSGTPDPGPGPGILSSLDARPFDIAGKSIAGSIFYWDTVDEFAQGHLTFQFEGATTSGHGSAEITVKYPPFSPGAAPTSYLEVSVGGNAAPIQFHSSISLDGNYEGLIASQYSELLPTAAYDDNLNPFISRFRDILPAEAADRMNNPAPVSVPDGVPAPGLPNGSPTPGSRAGILFPQLFMTILLRSFTYIANNGAFNEQKLNELSFFKNNASCGAPFVGDLMDTDGILDQMTQEFSTSACEDGDEIKDKIKDILRYGILNLLIQTYIVEFIVSNIIVFSAFRITDIFDSRYGIKEFIISSITRSIANGDLVHIFGGAGMNSIEVLIKAYFRRVMLRESTILAGGLVSPAGTIVIPTLEDLDTIPYESLVRFLVEERLEHVYAGGARSTLISISNVMEASAAGGRPPIEDIYIRDIIGFSKSTTTATSWLDSTPAASLDADYQLGGNVNIKKQIKYTSGGGTTYYVDATEFVATSAIPYSVDGYTKIYTLAYYLPERAAESQTGAYSDGFAASAYTAGPGVATRIIIDTINAGPILTNSTAGLPPVGPDLEELQRFASTVTQADIDTVKNDHQFQLFFQQVLSPQVMFLVPTLYSMFLTAKHFNKLPGAFNNTKKAVLNLLKSVNNSESRPQAEYPTSVVALESEMASGGDSNLDGMMREIMLKVLRETPIAILKGLVELIDPHIAIAKLIKMLTGEAFNQAAGGITAQIRSSGAGNPLYDSGVTGEDVLGLAFCGLNVINQQASNFAGGALPTGAAPEDGPLLGPKFTVDGIDFKGTVAGMFMAPPSPFGILYLLLSLLSQLDIPVDSDDEPVIDLLTPPDPDSCSD